jgi:hypothetical protein
MENSQALQIAISSITGILIPNNKAQKIIDVWEMVKQEPDSTTIKDIKTKGCACYGSNEIHKCFCK